MGLAGLEGELVQPLVRMMPAMVVVLIISLAAYWFYYKKVGKGSAPSKKSVEEADEWGESLIIGEVPSNRIYIEPLDPAIEIEEPEVELSYNGLRLEPLTVRAVKRPVREEPQKQSAQPLINPSVNQAVNPSINQAVNPPINQVINQTINQAVDQAVNQNGQNGALPAAPNVDRSPRRVTVRISNNSRNARSELTFDDGFVAGSHVAIESTIKAPLHQLPPSLPEFAGRSFELSELLAARANPEIKILGLQGLSGVGKTTLAIKLANQLAPHYPDAQIYIDLKGASPLPLPVTEAQAQIIRAYLPTVRLPENEVELNRMYQAVLSGNKALFLLDNAANAQQVIPLLPPDGCLSIITSRQQITLPGSFVSRLDSLSAPEARELLQRILPRIGERADEIAELCGRLPLALRLAGSALTQHPELSTEDYARRLAQRQKQERPLPPIEAVLHLSYELLFPNLKKLWRMLAVFSDTFDVSAAASVWRMNPARAAESLNCLMTYSLVERNRAIGRFRLHDLMLHFADACLSSEERTVVNHLHSAHYQSVLHEADALYGQGGKFLKQGLALLDLEWRNIQAGQVWAAAHADQSRSACELCASYPDAGKYVRDLRQHPRERIRWSEAALASAKLLKRRKAAGRHLVALGDSYIDLSESHHAIECYEQALEMARSSSDYRGEADALSGLGTAYYFGGGLNRARELHEAALEIARSIKDQRVEAIALGNLGVTHYALGEAHSATVLFDQQLRIAREIGDRRNESSALGGLGTAYYSLNNTKFAVSLLTQQLIITREIGDRRGEASALCNLGSAYASLKKYPQAIAFNEQSLAIAREIGDRRIEANALGGLGAAYYMSGDVEVGMQFLEHQHKLAAEIGDRRSESLALINLGEACITKGNARRAIELLQQAFNLTTQIGDIQGQAYSLFKLAIALDKFGDRKQAIAQAQTALELFEVGEYPSAALVREQLDEWQK